MIRQRDNGIQKGVTLVALGWLFAAAALAIVPAVSLAQFAEPLVAPGDVLPIPPGEPLPQPQAPPPGNGPTPLPVNPGDSGAVLPPPSGQADRSHGNVFPAGVGHDRTIVRVYKRSSGGAGGTDRGNRMVQTIRPDQLSAEQLDKIEGILGINMRSGEQSVDIIASDSQIEQVQEALMPYPQFQMEGGRKKINRDGRQNPNDSWTSVYGKTNLFDFKVPPPGQKPGPNDHPVPTVRAFARYLVILAVVVTNVYLIWAAASITWGTTPYDAFIGNGGANRAIGILLGLGLMLSAYTWWKVVQMNTFNRNSDTPAISQNRPFDAQQDDAHIQPPTVPRPPAGGGRQFPQRSGFPVEPLGGHG